VQIINQAQADELLARLPFRSKYIFLIGMETGLRISDILILKIKDIENPLHVYVSRTDTIQRFLISESLYAQLTVFAGLRYPDNYLFPSTQNKRLHLHRTTYHRDLKRATAELGFVCSAHSTRKFYLRSK